VNDFTRFFPYVTEKAKGYPHFIG